MAKENEREDYFVFSEEDIKIILEKSGLLELLEE